LGVKAAQEGSACVPETLYVRRQDQVNFAFGFESVSGPTFTTAQFTGSPLPQPAPVTAKTHGWSDFNADRALRQASAHLARIDQIFERTARETPEAAGDLLWLPA
jgi:hypothetical protein